MLVCRSTFACAVLATWLALPQRAHAITVDTSATLGAKAADESTATRHIPSPAEVKAAPPGRVIKTPPPGNPDLGSVPEFGGPTPLVLATWNGGTFTDRDLSATLGLRRPASASTIVEGRPHEASRGVLREVTKDLIFELALVEKAKKEGITSATPDIAKALKDFTELALSRSYYELEVQRRSKTVEDEGAMEYYESHKAEQFTRPARTFIQAMHVPLLDDHVATAGETLESIAKTISGDPEARWGILRGTAPFAPRMPQGEARGVVPALDARVGERLLVPVSPAEAKRREALANEARESILKGEKPADVAARIKPMRFEGASFMPDAGRMSAAELSAVDALTSSSPISPVIRGPWGYDILMLARRETSETLPFAEVRDKIVKAMNEDDKAKRLISERLRRAVFEDLHSTHGITLNMEALERKDYLGGDPLTGSTWIVRAGEFSYKLDDYLKDLATGGRSWSQMTTSERVEMAKSAPAVLKYLVLAEGRRTGADLTPQFQSEMESKVTQEIARYMLRRLVQDDPATTESTLRDYYRENLDRYTSASLVTVREITRRVELGVPSAEREANIAKAKAELDELRSKIGDSREEFEKQARRASGAISTRSRGGLVGTVPIGWRGPVVQAEIEKLKPGQVTPAFLYGQEVMILRLDEEGAAIVQPFEEVRMQVLKDYLREVPKKRSEARRDAILKEAGLKLNI